MMDKTTLGWKDLSIEQALITIVSIKCSEYVHVCINHLTGNDKPHSGESTTHVRMQ